MKNKTLAIIKAGLLAGTLDITSAFIYYFIKTGKTDVLNVSKYIASGLFGKQALTGGTGIIITGLFLHYLIAFVFTLVFFALFPRIKILSVNLFLTGIIYGIFIWIVMNLIVVPLSAVKPRPFNAVSAIINVLILIVCIGIPLAFLAGKYYPKSLRVSEPS